ncbi:uncharacterized protein LOC34621931 [Cyclospora cayetanensis]|uniref:Uncharacterized protein LOC34621931 n=1 Tax=Cyclospora cayetanensis TaxID=88456 RepID=A0A6P6RZU3_9EIME|nr:uncharacterized protein LOC34621931 [Cyclospora cayetanensis]
MRIFSSFDYETYFGPGVRYEPIRDGFLVFPPLYPDRVFILQASEHPLLQQQRQQQQQEEEPGPEWLRVTPDAKVKRAAAALAGADGYGAPEFELGGPHGATGAPGLIPERSPSYVNPRNPFLRTGRLMEYERREADSGPQQRQKWGMDDVKGDIPRGPQGAPNDRFKLHRSCCRRNFREAACGVVAAAVQELVDSVDWTREHPTLVDKNHYKRSFLETGIGDPNRNTDSYFDPQFFGAVEGPPYAADAGSSFSWALYWVPWLAKKHIRGGQPIKSDCFSLGGIDPLQLWFYPDGTPESLPGFCSLKLITRPGWHLPFPVTFWVQGAPALPHFQRQKRQEWRQQEHQQHKRAQSRRTTSKGSHKTQPVAPHHDLSRPSRVSVGPIWRELLDKGSYQVSMSPPPLPPSELPSEAVAIHFNPETDVVLDAFGGVQVGVAVGDQEWEWDGGAVDYEQWLKRQSAYPDDNELEQTLPPDFTHSPHYENFKYADVPDKHFSRYLPAALPPAITGERLEAALMRPGNPY